VVEKSRQKAAPHGFKPGQSGNPAGRPKGLQNKATRELKEFARSLLESKRYRRLLKRRINAGTAGRIEELLYHYAYGKPHDTVELGPNAMSVVDLVKRAASDR
jgi:hypothetical protein